MRYWWVNQNQTYSHEVGGGYLWSPKTNANGTKNQFYENMTLVAAGDVIFSYCDTTIKAIGLAQGRASTAAKPAEFGRTGQYWGKEGWYVPVEYTELKTPLKPKARIDQLSAFLPAKYSPLQANGNGNQAVYLAAVPDPLADAILKLLTDPVQEIISADTAASTDDDEDDKEETNLRSRPDIPDTEKAQLIKARRGQGLFRSRVELVEPACRITGVTAKKHLRASHIKPWRISTNKEKLDGHNGLLLAPHADHLFDRGYITFNDNGSLLVSPRLSNAVVAAWHIDVAKNVGPFRPEQWVYLAYHRHHVFRNKRLATNSPIAPARDSARSM